MLDSSGARATNPTGIDPIAVTVDSIGVGTPGSAWWRRTQWAGSERDDGAIRVARERKPAVDVYVVGATRGEGLAAGDSIEMLFMASAEPTGWVSQTLVLTRSSHLVLFGRP